ncbi:MAG TPA: 30S ribosomal protein S16, partial [Candidatus Acidoferrales bacterium]|nr:30S ribosomal protein S16 [Candidatus Acidoferrales bacterium]
TIRMARHGAKKHPFYRIIVTDSRAPRNGRRLDQVGTYDPSQNPPRVQFQEEKLTQWLRRGARPSLTVAQLIKRSGIAPAGAAGVPVPEPAEAQT